MILLPPSLLAQENNNEQDQQDKFKPVMDNSRPVDCFTLPLSLLADKAFMNSINDLTMGWITLGLESPDEDTGSSVVIESVSTRQDSETGATIYDIEGFSSVSNINLAYVAETPDNDSFIYGAYYSDGAANITAKTTGTVTSITLCRYYL